MYATPDCQAATPLQVPAGVVVGEAVLLVDVVVPATEEVVIGEATLLVDVVGVPAAEEVVVCDGCVDDPAQALTAI